MTWRQLYSSLHSRDSHGYDIWFSLSINELNCILDPGIVIVPIIWPNSLTCTLLTVMMELKGGSQQSTMTLTYSRPYFYVIRNIHDFNSTHDIHNINVHRNIHVLQNIYSLQNIHILYNLHVIQNIHDLYNIHVLPDVYCLHKIHIVYNLYAFRTIYIKYYQNTTVIYVYSILGNAYKLYLILIV